MIGVLTGMGMAVRAVSALTVYDLPAGAETFGSYKVTVNGQPVPVHRAIQNDSRANDEFWDLDYGDYGFVQVDCNGAAHIRIESNLAIDQAVLRPLADQVEVQFPKPNIALFTLQEPGQYSFEPFGPCSPLLVFVNPEETRRVDPEDEGVVYFGPGLHRPEGGIIYLTDNQTLYLDGGAVVQAGLRIEGTNVTVCGRGILDGSPWTWRNGPEIVQVWQRDEKGRIRDRGHMNQVRDSRDVRFEGIIVRGAWQWTFYLENSEDISFENIKIVGGKNHNDDGIDPVNSRRITVRDSFIRTADDCFALKGHRFKDGAVEDLLVENCVLWTETQRIMLLGHESRAPAMRNIIFRNIDVIHMGPNIGIALHPGEKMFLEHILFEDIRINSDGYVGVINPVRVIDIQPTVNQFMHKKVPGHVRDVVFRDIVVHGSEKRKRIIRVFGHDPQHRVEDIRFENVTVHGEKARRRSRFVRIGQHTSNITLK